VTHQPKPMIQHLPFVYDNI